MIVLVGLGAVLAVKPVESREPPANRVLEAIRILSGIPSGKALLARAREFWNVSKSEELVRVFKWGAASKTDAVLTRHFDPRTGTERRERQVSIFLRQNQSLEAIVLDIAHELVHATSHPSWDPYDPKLTPGKYIQAAIEGEGGEVDAVVSECQVSLELSSHPSASQERCQSYVSASQRIDRERVKRDFYRVGDWNEDLLDRLGPESTLFPLLSDQEPRLYSSTGHAPYPVALYREFEELNQLACENSRKRISLSASASRSPASIPEVSEDGAAGARFFLAQRCK